MFSASLIRLLRDESGASAVEYGLILGLVALVLIATLNETGSSIDHIFSSTTDKMKIG